MRAARRMVSGGSTLGRLADGLPLLIRIWSVGPKVSLGWDGLAPATVCFEKLIRENPYLYARYSLLIQL